MLKKIASLVAAVGIALVGFAAPASATPSLSGTRPATAVENTTVPLALTLTGATWDKALVTITVEEGTLTVTAAGDVVASPGYDLSDTTQSVQSFYGSTADVVETIASGIDWVTPSTAGNYDLVITVRAQEYLDGLSYNPDNGHYYLVPSDENGDPIEDYASDFFGAADAGDYVYAGITGYVAEIGDEAENDFVADYSGGEDIWIGGSSETSIVNDYSSATTTNSDIDWYWIHSGTQFASGLDTDGEDPDTADAFNGAFMSFNLGEPNGGNGNEGCLVTNVGGNAGYWNDLECSGTSNPAILEFEPTGNETDILTITQDDLTVLAETGVEANGIVLLAGALALAGAGAVIYRRRRA